MYYEYICSKMELFLHNNELLLETRKLQALSEKLEKMMMTLKEACNYIELLERLGEQYTIQYDVFNNFLSNLVFDENTKQKIEAESNLHTKEKLRQEYNIIKTRYESLSELYTKLDRTNYIEMLDSFVKNALL